MSIEVVHNIFEFLKKTERATTLPIPWVRGVEHRSGLEVTGLELRIYADKILVYPKLGK